MPRQDVYGWTPPAVLGQFFQTSYILPYFGENARLTPIFFKKEARNYYDLISVVSKEITPLAHLVKWECFHRSSVIYRGLF